MTLRDVYTTVAEQLLKQGARSMLRDVEAYRDKAGRKDAIGCLIPDELYYKELEYAFLWNLNYKSGKWVGFGPARNAELADIFNKIDIPPTEDCWGLLCDLRNMHLTVEPAEWKRKLAEIGARYGLNA